MDHITVHTFIVDGDETMERLLRQTPEVVDADVSFRTVATVSDLGELPWDSILIARGVGLSMSVGMGHTGGAMKDVDAFIKQSDERMYEQKVAKKAQRDAA